MEKPLQNHFTAVFTFKTTVNGHIYIAFYKKKFNFFYSVSYRTIAAKYH
jgi:hypothetical protein